MSSKQQAQRTRRKARSRTIICGEFKLPSSHLTTNYKIFDQRKVAFSQHDHVTRNKTSTERCEKWPATQVPAFQLHSPQTLLIKVPLTGAIFPTRHEGETQSRANSRIETQKKKRKTSKDFRLHLQLHSAISSHKQNQQPDGTREEGSETTVTGKQRPGLTKYRHQLLMHLMALELGRCNCAQIAY